MYHKIQLAQSISATNKPKLSSILALMKYARQHIYFLNQAYHFKMGPNPFWNCHLSKFLNALNNLTIFFPKFLFTIRRGNKQKNVKILRCETKKGLPHCDYLLDQSCSHEFASIFEELDNWNIYLNEKGFQHPLNSEVQKWYFDSKIVLTFCEKKLF